MGILVDEIYLNHFGFANDLIFNSNSACQNKKKLNKDTKTVGLKRNLHKNRVISSEQVNIFRQVTEK